ncbi:PilZ domain-containing protein [Sphingomonas antarctica]|uniref:PilZ domain-containing protein n=1 Tax=Sphingomonas antarctica TaxID=2040274 RepID=UPI0039E75ED5
MTILKAVTADSRQAERETLILTARLKRVGSAAFAVTVRNLSAVGMMVEGETPLTVDEAVVAEIAGLGKVPGRIAWTQEDRAGMAFDAPVDPTRARRPRLTAV